MKRGKEVSLVSQGTRDRLRRLCSSVKCPPWNGTLIAAPQFLTLACAIVVSLAAPTRAATWYVSPPVTNASPLRFSAIAAGGFSLGVQSNGMVVAWGGGQSGLPSGLTDVISVAAGAAHVLALKSDGTVLAWGDNTYGQTNMPRGLSNVVAISAQNYHSLALRSDGGVVRWGWIGDIYAPVPGDLTNAVAIAAGAGHDLAIRADGTVEAWGQNGQGQCNVPAGLSGIVGIAGGNGYSLALKADGTIVAWGASTETNLPSGLTGVIAISADWANCAALKSDGTIVTWGINNPVPAGLSNVVAIATGPYHDLALRSDGSVVAWANNCSDQFQVPGTSVTGGDIQSAVNQANDGDTVLVGAGWYEPTNQIVITNAIALRSVAGPDQTTINVKFADYGLWVSNSAAVVDGLTLRGGFFDNCHPVSERGRGIFLVGGTVQNCQFTNNRGNAVYMLGGRLTNCVVSYGAPPPSGGRIAVYCGAGGLVTDCRIVNAIGGLYGLISSRGIYLERSQLRNSVISGALGYGETSDGWAVDAHWSTIVGCTITPTQSGSGAFLDNCVMDRCIVTHNSNRRCSFESGGGGIYESNSFVFNSLILSNGVDLAAPDCGDEQHAQCGGGVFMIGGALVNCTVVGNAARHGAGVYIKEGNLTNCIIYGNRIFPGNDWEIVGPAIFDHCCTTPDPGGAGNIILDPQFVGPANGDFHLLPSSLCNSAGVVQDWMAGAFELGGNPRTAYGFVDIGAYQTIFATPQDRAEGLMGAVTFLVQQGALSQQQANSLLGKVQAAERSMNAGRAGPACNQMGAFVKQVGLLTETGALTPTLGQALANTANALEAAIGCPRATF